MTNDGGPAFPAFPAAGMTLRDWFAGQALVGILGSRNGFLVDCGIEYAPSWAYRVADAMLKERAK